jgi:hypothetical protein
VPIRIYLKDSAAFGPDAIATMSEALDQACRALNIEGEIKNRQIIAERIIELARTGVLDAKLLSERVVAETKAMRSV